MQTMRDAIGLGSQTNGTQIQSATIGNINPAQVQAQQIQDSNVNVFAEGIKGLQQTAGAIYEGVQDRKKLVALDASTQYNVGMQHIDKYYSDIEATGKALTSKDISSRMEWKQKFHSDMVGRTVDGVVSENYNKDFDDEIVKKGFIEPAVGYLNKSYSADAKQFQELEKLEYISTVKNQAAILGSDVTSSSVQTWIGELTKRGVQYPEALVYGLVRDNFNVMYDEKFKDGLLSTSITPFLKEGVLTEKSKDELFNSIYKEFIIRKDGIYTKVDKNLTDADEKSMLKGFDSWVDKSSKGLVIETVTKTNSTTYNTEAPAVIQARLDSSYKHLLDLRTLAMAGNKNAIPKYTQALQGYEEMSKKLSQSISLTNTYNNFLSGEYNIIEDKTYEHNIYNPNNLEPTVSSDIIKAHDVAMFISEKAYNDYNVAIKKGDSNTATKLLYSIGRLETLGYTSPQITNVNNIFSSNDKTARKLESTSNIKEFMSTLDSAIGYKSSVMIDAPHLTKTIIDNVENYYNDQLNRIGDKDADGKQITEESIFNNTKVFYRLESSRVTSALKENQRAKAGMILGLSMSESQGDKMDEFVSGNVFGYVPGKSVFGDNTLNVALEHSIENGASTRGELGADIKSKLVMLDSTYIPFVSTGLVLFNPTSLSADKFRNNFKDVIKYNVGEYQSTKNIDFGDIVDEDISISQRRVYSPSAKSSVVVTTAHIKDSSGRILHSVLLYPDDIAAGVSASEKARYSVPTDIVQSEDITATIQNDNRTIKF
jgi:hypothetical protein